jgi:hypothetical protein
MYDRHAIDQDAALSIVDHGSVTLFTEQQYPGHEVCSVEYLGLRGGLENFDGIAESGWGKQRPQDNRAYDDWKSPHGGSSCEK